MYEYNELLKENLQKTSSGGGSQMTVDAALSETSTNPVQNKVITEALKPLNTQKVTKFFSADATLEDDEIAEYQGKNDNVNNLVNGYFYKTSKSQQQVEKEIVTYNPYYYARINKVFPAVESAKVYNNDLESETFGNFSYVTFILNGDRSETFDIFLFPISDNYFISDSIIDSDAVTDFDLQGTGFYYMSKFALCTIGQRQWQRFSISIDNNNNVLIDNIIATPVGWSKNVKNRITTEFSEYNNKIYPTVSINTAYKLYYLRPITYPIPVDDFIIVADFREEGVYRFPHEVAAPLNVQTFEFEVGVGFQQTDTQPRTIIIVSANYITNNLSDILTQYTNIVQDTVFVLTDIDSAKIYNYTFNSQTKTFKGNSEYDLLFRYCGNNEFKAISFSPIY